MARRKLTRTDYVLFAVFGAAIVALPTVLVGRVYCQAADAERGPGKPLAAWIDGDGALVLADHIEELVAADHRWLRIDPVTGRERGRRLADQWPEAFEHEQRFGACATVEAIDGARGRIAVGGRGVIAVGEVATEGAPARPPGADFRDPQLLAVRPPDGGALVWDGKQVAAIDDDGQQRWIVHVGGGCQHVSVAGGVVAVATTDGHHRAWGLDLATGEVRWKVAF